MGGVARARAESRLELCEDTPRGEDTEKRLLRIKEAAGMMSTTLLGCPSAALWARLATLACCRIRLAPRERWRKPDILPHACTETETMMMPQRAPQTVQQ